MHLSLSLSHDHHVQPSISYIVLLRNQVCTSKDESKGKSCNSEKVSNQYAQSGNFDPSLSDQWLILQF